MSDFKLGDLGPNGQLMARIVIQVVIYAALAVGFAEVLAGSAVKAGVAFGVAAWLRTALVVSDSPDDRRVWL